MLGASRAAGEAARTAAASALQDAAAYSLNPADISRARGARAALWRLVRSIPWPICVITAIAGTLRFAHIEGVSPNPFYDAAVRSMSLSWHNFFFAAFDPGAILSVDKPPLDLWLQVVSVKLLGWGQLALRLPEALAGTLAVPLLYDATRRVVGKPAALGTAATLTVLPESVLTARSDTMDSMMMLLVIAALWLTIRACRSGQRRTIVLAGAMLGLAFNVKLLEALIAGPALAALYLIAGTRSRRRQLVDLGAAGLTVVVVGLSWAAAVSLSPGRAPWPIGSSDGTVWNAIFVFNGFGRASVASATKPGGPGPFRLLVSTGWHYDVLFGCVLVAAVAIGAAAALRALRSAVGQQRIVDSAGASRRLPSALAIALALWIVLSTLVFDGIAIVHARYLEALAPAVAAAIGYGAAALAGLTGTDERPGRPAALAGALALVCVCVYTLHFTPHFLAWGAASLILALIGAGMIARSSARHATSARWLLASLILGCALVFPVHETLSLVRSNANDSLGLATMPTGTITALSSFLGPRTVGVRYELAVDEPLALAPLIIRDRRPIFPLTSFGTRIEGVPQLRDEVRAGRVRYALVGSFGCGPQSVKRAGCAPAAIWIRQHGKDVSASAGIVGRARLYLLTPDRAA